MAIEEHRLHWIWLNQNKFKTDLRQGLMNTISRGDIDANEVKSKTIFPSSHTGSLTYHMQNYPDAMALY